MESDQDALSELSPEVASNLSRSVVSLSLSHGDYVSLLLHSHF